MAVCSEGLSYKNPQLIDKIYNEAKIDNELGQIFEAKDEDGDLPLHKAANFGNPTCIEWIFDTWKQHNQPIDVDAVDHQGYTPLYLVCHRGYIGVEGVESNTPETRQKRMECVKILIEKGANVNYRTPKLQMTPLHWAAYQGDAEMV